MKHSLHSIETQQQQHIRQQQQHQLVLQYAQKQLKSTQLEPTQLPQHPLQSVIQPTQQEYTILNNDKSFECPDFALEISVSNVECSDCNEEIITPKTFKNFTIE